MKMGIIVTSRRHVLFTTFWVAWLSLGLHYFLLCFFYSCGGAERVDHVKQKYKKYISMCTDVRKG